jgi:hypothetical protein
MMPMSNSWWIGPFVLAIIRLLYVEAQLTRTAVKGRDLLFRAGTGIRLLFGSGIIGFSVGIFTNIGHEENWLLLLAACLVLTLCFAWPVTLVIGEDRLRRSVWWRRSLVIPWNEVSGVERNIGGEIQVFGKNGQCITFSRFHVDPIRFQGEVMRRAGLREVLNTSDPPSLRK